MNPTGVRWVPATIALVWSVWMLFLGLDERRRVVGFGDDESAVVQHLLGFAVLGALLILVAPRNPLTVWLVLVAAGMLGEIIQLGIADRDFSFADIIVGAIGARVGTGVGVVLSESRLEFAALVVPCALLIASPVLVVLAPDAPQTAFPEDLRRSP